MHHITIEKIILGLDEKDLKHIEECENCRELYELMTIGVDQNVIDSIDAKVRENVMIKFKEMKMKRFNKSEEKRVFATYLKYVLSFSLVLLLVAVGVLTWLISSNVRTDKVMNVSGSRLILDHGSASIKEIEIYSSNSVLNFTIPGWVKSFSLSAFPSSDVKEVVVKYGNMEYKFAANNFRLEVKEGKVFVNGSEAKIIKKVFKNVIYLSDGSEVIGNLLGIKDGFIIFETSEGVKNFDRRYVKKIIYR